MTPFDRVRAYCAAHPHVALWDEPTRTLFDVYSAKPLAVDPARVVDSADQIAADTGEPYVVARLDDDRQLAIAPMGIAWPP